jgi:hypothetical protein
MAICPSESAQTVVIPPTNRAWFSETGFHSLFLSTGNYVTGDLIGGHSNYRNVFVFDLTELSQPILSAQLALTVPVAGYGSPDSSENYELHDVVTPIATLQTADGIAVWNDLGTGVVYGSRTMTAADIGTVVEIELNSSAVAAMNATHGPFGFGGSLTTLDNLKNDEYVFGHTGSGQSLAQLRITYVPEPSSVLLCLAAIFAILMRRSRSRS